MQYNVKNLVKTIAGQKKTANKVFNQANTEQEFMTLLSQKSYLENYSLLYYTALFFAFISQLATAVSSYTFFADLLAIKLGPTLLPFAVAILLLLIEVLKFVSFNKGLEGVFALPQRINYVLLVFAILLSAGSMYASIIGGGSFGIDTKRIVSTETKFDAEIKNIREDIADIKSRNTWKNQTWLPKKEKALVYSKESELTQLKLQKEQHLADVATDNEIAATQYKFGFAFFDALFLLCTLYVWYFRKNVAVEGMVNENVALATTIIVQQPVTQQPISQIPETTKFSQQVAKKSHEPPHRKKDYLKHTPIIKEVIKKENDDENRTDDNDDTRQEKKILNEIKVENRQYENRQEMLGVRRCLNIANCNNDFVANHKKQKFCCDNCRKQHWEEKTQRPLVFKKKSKDKKVSPDLFA
jgi:hypothetical protein